MGEGVKHLSKSVSVIIKRFKPVDICLTGLIFMLKPSADITKPGIINLFNLADIICQRIYFFFQTQGQRVQPGDICPAIKVISHPA